MVPPKGLTWHISDIFLTYAQCFDVVPHLNPKYPAHAGLFPESVMSMFSLKQAVCAGGVPLGDIIPVSQLCTCGLDTQIWSTSRSLLNEADEFCIQH